jgi:hypothetical protein
MTCAWADYDGYHLAKNDGCPPAAPAYSHLWAWSPQQLVRVRVDSDHGIIGVLTTNAEAPAGSLSFEQVDVMEREAMSFRDPPTTIRLVQVVGPMPLVFVAENR